ncbi:G-type lectin S-receptor-like serine/threonine-protein kinase, partial [Thalictrum thalictroides]
EISISSNCGDACLSDCECVASVYGLKEETAYCWILRSVEFGRFEDPGSTLFVKVDKNGSTPPNTRNGNSTKRSSSYRNKSQGLQTATNNFTQLLGASKNQHMYLILDHCHRRILKSREAWEMGPWWQ